MSFISNVLRFVTRKPPAEISWSKVSNVETYFYKGDLESASDAIQSLIDSSSGFALDYYKILEVRLLGEKNDVEGIKSKLENFDVSSPEAHPILVNLVNIEEANQHRLEGDFQTAVEMLKNASEEINQLKLYYPYFYKKNTIRLNILEAKILNRLGQFETSVKRLNNALHLLEEIGDEAGKAEAYNDLGISYASLADAENGLKNLNRSLEIYKDLGNNSQSLKIYNNIGMIEMQTGKLDDALNSFNQSLKMTRELGITRYSATILQNIALIYYQTGKLEESLENYNESLKLFEELQFAPNIAKVQMNLAGIYQIMGDYNKALSLMKSARKTYEENEMKQDLAEVLSNIANIHTYNGFTNKAIDLIKQSIEINEEIGNFTKIIHPLFNGIEVSIKMGNLEQAEEFLEKFEHAKNQQPNNLSEQLYKLCKALILLESDRVVKQAEAQTLLQEIADDDIYSLDYTVHALLKLGDLLLKELRLSASEEALQEFKNLIDRLDTVTKSSADQSAAFKPTIIQVLMLKSKLALIDLEVDKAQQILTDAHDIAKSSGLKELMKSINAERDTIKNEMMKYKQMVDTNASLYERLQESQIENYLKKAESILKK